MEKVNNAIILAAGRGSRLKELTDNVPKPLLAPRGKKFIDEIIRNLHEKNINEIYVVTGYKAEKFKYLESQQGIILINNKNWDKGNNVTSIKAAINHLGNSLIINGDIIINKNIIANEFNNSLTYVEINENIDEWIINVDKDNMIDSIEKNGLLKTGFYQRELTFVNTELAEKVKLEIDGFDQNEYQEDLMLYCSKKYNIPFGIYIIPKNLVYDLDTKEEYLEYIDKK